ncbi:hypothetical protein ACFLIM_49285 [Nonomuraea sp. M3C6]|uniref:Uncharacterized protein n=1 Tax=Nonomuraea marmarensis TaxID=3351344 RepID=A0ABW7AYS8_9ACTN
MSVEEGVGDTGFALDGLESDRLAALDQRADGGLGRFRLDFGFAAGGLVEVLMRRWRWSVMSAASGGG